MQAGYSSQPEVIFVHEDNSSTIDNFWHTTSPQKVISLFVTEKLFCLSHKQLKDSRRLGFPKITPSYVAGSGVL